MKNLSEYTLLKTLIYDQVLATFMDNYTELVYLLNSSIHASTDTGMKARLQGGMAVMLSFRILVSCFFVKLK